MFFDSGHGYLFFLFQSLHWTCFLAFVAEDALRGVFSLSRILVDFHIHRADFQALAALDALAFVATDTQSREIAHRLQEHGDGAEVFAEGAVVAEDDGQGDAHHVIDEVPDEEQAEKHLVGRLSKVKQHPDENQRERENDVTDESELLSGTLWLFVRQQVENHGRPAGIAAPTSAKKQRPENLGYEIMECGAAEDAGSQVEPEPFDLHVLLAYQPKENQHVRADGKLDELPRIFLPCRSKGRPQANANADIRKVEQEKQVASREPHGDGYRFKHQKENDGGLEFFHGVVFTIDFSFHFVKAQETMLHVRHPFVHDGTGNLWAKWS